jgi:hypothetical protein
MRKLMLATVVCVLAAISSSPLSAADIRLIPALWRLGVVAGGEIAIDGEIMSDDDRRFKDIAQQAAANPNLINPKAGILVTLSGPGGNLAAALKIGTEIHNRGWDTFVEPDKSCESACGYIWIAGNARWAANTSHIGFHAAYSAKTRQETGTGNAVLGSYLTRMGLNYDAIAYLTASGPTQMTYLSAEAAAKYGIDVLGGLPPEASLAPPQTMKKVVGRPYIDANGNYIIPADIVPYIAVTPETMIAHPPNYQVGLASLQHLIALSKGTMSAAADGSVIISAQAVLTIQPKCTGTCAYQAMDVFMNIVLDRIHRIETGIVPPQEPETRTAGQQLCPEERQRLAWSYGSTGNPKLVIRSLELCPVEMCPMAGRRLMQTHQWAMAVARLCPNL